MFTQHRSWPSLISSNSPRRVRGYRLPKDPPFQGFWIGQVLTYLVVFAVWTASLLALPRPGAARNNLWGSWQRHPGTSWASSFFFRICFVVTKKVPKVKSTWYDHHTSDLTKLLTIYSSGKCFDKLKTGWPLSPSVLLWDNPDVPQNRSFPLESTYFPEIKDWEYIMLTFHLPWKLWTNEGINQNKVLVVCKNVFASRSSFGRRPRSRREICGMLLQHLVGFALGWPWCIIQNEVSYALGHPIYQRFLKGMHSWHYSVLFELQKSCMYNHINQPLESFVAGQKRLSRLLQHPEAIVGDQEQDE